MLIELNVLRKLKTKCHRSEALGQNASGLEADHIDEWEVEVTEMEI